MTCLTRLYVPKPIAMKCFRCGIDISEGYWLADGGPLCGECGQDVRVQNVAINRERERRENMKHGNLLLDGLDELREAAPTNDERRSITYYAIGAASAEMTPEQQESVLKCVRNCVRMYQEKNKDSWVYLDEVEVSEQNLAGDKP